MTDNNNDPKLISGQESLQRIAQRLFGQLVAQLTVIRRAKLL